MISVEPQLAAKHFNVPSGEVKLSEAASILFRLLLAVDHHLLVHVNKNEIALIDTRRTRLLIRFSGSSGSVHYEKFERLSRHAATYTGYRAGNVQPQEFQRAWSTIVDGRPTPAKLIRHDPGTVIAAMMGWMASEKSPAAPIVTEAQIKERMGMYAAKLDS